MKEWHCVLYGQPHGPFTEKQLAEMASANSITRETLVWSNSSENAELGWLPIAQTELAAIFTPPAPIFAPEQQAEPADAPAQISASEQQEEPANAPGPPSDAREISPAIAEILNIFQASGGPVEPVRDLLLSQLEQSKEQSAAEYAEQTQQVFSGGSPLAKSTIPEPDFEPELASFERRLAAFAINFVIPLALGLIFFSVPYFWSFKMRTVTVFIAAVTSLMTVGYIGYSFHLLETSGQSMGKKFMRIRISDPRGDDVALWKIMTLRWSLCGLSLALIYFNVYAGLFVFLADTCFIFGRRRRTLHDRIAGTIVISAPAESAES